MPISALQLFIRASDVIVKFEASFFALKAEEHNATSLEMRSEELKKLWEKAKTAYEDCLCEIQESKEADIDDIDIADAKYNTTFNSYVRCVSVMEEKLEVLKPKTVHYDTPGGNPMGASTFVTPNTSQSISHVSLPHYDVDIFHGGYLSWPKFRDHFDTVFIRSNLSPIQRMLFLIQKTSGEAREIVDKFPVENSSFELAWEALSSAYNNPRMLVNNQLKILFGLPVLESESGTGLKSLQRGINGCLSAMQVYDIATDNWDPILVFMCMQRLPKQTVALWEQSVKQKTALSSWKDLNNFLTERVQTLDCLRDLTTSDSQKRSSEKRVKSHHTSAQSSSRNKSSNAHNSASTQPCVLCSTKSHLLRVCPKFQKMSVSDRFSAVKRYRCCVNCLAKVHDTRDCPSSHRCMVPRCGRKHHTLLHREFEETVNSHNLPSAGGNIPTNPSSSFPQPINNNNTVHPTTSTGISNFQPMNRQTFFTAQNRSVLLATAMVNIVHNGTIYPARALIDHASEASFITDSLLNRLKLPFKLTNATVSGVNQTVSSAKKLATFIVGSRRDPAISIKVSALALPNISGNLPSFSAPKETASLLPKKFWADPQAFDSRPVDLLLGAEIYDQLILLGQEKVLGSLVAQKTVFGWILLGSLPVPLVQAFRTQVEFSKEDNLNSTLLRFWEIEELPKKKMLSPEDKFCEENYRKTTRRDHEGRYIVTLPIKPDFPEILGLGDSRSNVLRQFLRNESSLLRRPEIKTTYDKVVNEYLHLGHMKRVIACPLPRNMVCYLPHHPVINPEKQTTKLRVVFNASNKTSNGKSLNDMLYVGPTLQSDLVLLILRWRLFRYVFNCDITQMYRQIKVDPSHSPFQRIVFRDSPLDEIRDYELQTVTFGVNCAPFLAIRTLLQLADDCEQQFPLAANILRNYMYVDDVLSGAHDISTAQAARDELILALSSAKFELRKWTANDKRILNRFSDEYLVDAKLLTFVESSNSKPLGIRWNAQLDSFYFCVAPIPPKTNHTKREVLSTIAKLFDPVGWLSPVIVVAKILMQKIWLDNIDWDDCLPERTEREWQCFIQTYPEVNNIRIPRWVQYTLDCSAELHVFADASERAFAGVIYIRIETPSGNVQSHLLSSKTKVAPVKSVSLPRLELCGAVLASELLKTVLSEIPIELQRVYCWTDSTIVLAWLKKTPGTWTTFVANRVCRIQENVGKHNWYHVRSEDNPADLGSRGLPPAELAASPLWWHGPLWLLNDKSQWNISDPLLPTTEVEKRNVKSHASFSSSFKDILKDFSSLNRASRVIAQIFRFFYRTHPAHKGRHTFASGQITGPEIKMVQLRLAILAQKVHFGDEYDCLLHKKPLPPKSNILSLNPYLDRDGVMRLNGRLAKSPSLSFSERHPILLPYASRFTGLLVELFHSLSIHGGNQLVLRLIRCEYWVPRLKTLIRKVINKCKPCLIQKKQTCTQIMAALPPERTAINRPFTNTGVDFAGPFEIKSFTGRACKITKGYVCVFVCFSTKAIHLEAASDLSTDIFLSAFNRFIARRGCPSTIFSDNGTNFVGASRELARNAKACVLETRDKVCSAFSYQGLDWRFIPAGAPHMGGLWESGVKSFKLHFRRQAKNYKYTFEEFSTLLARIEACLNSRPLCPLTDNPSEVVALTPGHFLIGSPILAPPEPNLEDSPCSFVNRYRKMLAIYQHFCSRWKNEYLSTLQHRYKWKHPERDLAIDDLVVVKHESLPPTAWCLGRVVHLHPGTDGHVRVVDVRTERGVIKRPVAKLVVISN